MVNSNDCTGAVGARERKILWRLYCEVLVLYCDRERSDIAPPIKTARPAAAIITRTNVQIFAGSFLAVQRNGSSDGGSPMPEAQILSTSL
jgi:hypothetical protein